MLPPAALPLRFSAVSLEGCAENVCIENAFALEYIEHECIWICLIDQLCIWNCTSTNSCHYPIFFFLVLQKQEVLSLNGYTHAVVHSHDVRVCHCNNIQSHFVRKPARYHIWQRMYMYERPSRRSNDIHSLPPYPSSNQRRVHIVCVGLITTFQQPYLTVRVSNTVRVFEHRHVENMTCDEDCQICYSGYSPTVSLLSWWSLRYWLSNKNVVCPIAYRYLSYFSCVCNRRQSDEEVRSTMRRRKSKYTSKWSKSHFSEAKAYLHTIAKGNVYWKN